MRYGQQNHPAYKTTYSADNCNQSQNRSKDKQFHKQDKQSYAKKHVIPNKIAFLTKKFFKMNFN